MVSWDCQCDFHWYSKRAVVWKDKKGRDSGRGWAEKMDTEDKNNKDGRIWTQERREGYCSRIKHVGVLDGATELAPCADNMVEGRLEYGMVHGRHFGERRLATSDEIVRWHALLGSTKNTEGDSETDGRRTLLRFLTDDRVVYLG